MKSKIIILIIIGFVVFLSIRTLVVFNAISKKPKIICNFTIDPKFLSRVDSDYLSINKEKNVIEYGNLVELIFYIKEARNYIYISEIKGGLLSEKSYEVFYDISFDKKFNDQIKMKYIINSDYFIINKDYMGKTIF